MTGPERSYGRAPDGMRPIAIEPGFATADVFSARVNLLAADSLRHRQFFETLERNLGILPGLTGVYLGNGLPGVGWRGGG